MFDGSVSKAGVWAIQAPEFKSSDRGDKSLASAFVPEGGIGGCGGRDLRCLSACLCVI